MDIRRLTEFQREGWTVWYEMKFLMSLEATSRCLILHDLRSIPISFIISPSELGSPRGNTVLCLYRRRKWKTSAGCLFSLLICEPTTAVGALGKAHRISRTMVIMRLIGFSSMLLMSRIIHSRHSLYCSSKLLCDVRLTAINHDDALSSNSMTKVVRCGACKLKLSIRQ
ncbi:hypothetical protein F5Y06DRAFT_118120 [Hypoxylon sp. FL0890]|nr:hypothetical protein F5Y06DRAFT_118120 [Hypoxylon sp. FL0890]